jgi:EAL domain-containing protein (putative c-di-GMP-specific phosphodiesterase class I)/PAS domain-containing protein
MSAQLSQHVTTRLLIAEKSENAATELDSTLRDAGIATKPLITDDLAHIAQVLAQGEVDIALLTDKLDGLDQFLPRMRENAPQTPIIFLTRTADQDQTTGTPLLPADAMSLGATDVVPADDFQQITLVVKRELEHVCEREHFAQVRRALKEAEQRCQLLLQGSKAAIAYVHEGMHIHANEGYLDLFGFSDTDDLLGASLVDLLDDESSEQLKGQLKNLRNGADDALLDFKSRDLDGRIVTGTMTLANSQYEGEDCLQITVRSQRQGEVADGETADAPTTPSDADHALELPGFVKSAESLFANSNDEPFVFVAGIDNFAESQCAYGLIGAEAIGRKVWQQLAEAAQDYPVTRVASHQYALALTAPSSEEATATANRLREAVNGLILEVQDKTVRPTMTFAGELLQEAGVSRTLDIAHQNLLECIEAGAANKVVLTEQEVEESDELDDAKIILRQITEAIEKRMFVLLFQPIISLRGDADEHYEVFLRMLDGEGNQIEPGRFLQTAIDNNVAGKIDRWVILQSIKTLSVHRSKGHSTRLTINLTCNSVADPEFLQWLTVAIKAARLPSDAVIFQITEKDATTYLRQTREFIEGLRAMHCRASLSRFGLIADPFETLRHLPVDIVKLDGTLVEGMDDEEKRATLIEQITQLQGAGKLTVVPMVENANLLSTLWQAGANYIQGHYLQEPTTEMDYDFSTEE